MIKRFVRSGLMALAASILLAPPLLAGSSYPTSVDTTSTLPSYSSASGTLANVDGVSGINNSTAQNNQTGAIQAIENLIGTNASQTAPINGALLGGGAGGASSWTLTPSGLTSISATTLTGTLSTAAQPNITSVGILAGTHLTSPVVDSGGMIIGGASASTGVFDVKGPSGYVTSVQSTGASALTRFDPTSQDGWSVGAGASVLNDFGITDVTQPFSAINITGGASGGFATFSRSIAVGAPAGGDKGAGTINVATGIYLNGTAYTNPDYVLEQWATGRIARYADKPGASTYQPLTLPQMEAYARTNLALPGFGQTANNDLFSGSDQLLARVEDGYRYLFDHEARLNALTTGEYVLGILLGASMAALAVVAKRGQRMEARLTALEHGVGIS